MESREMISAPRRWASSIPTLVLPVAVAPARYQQLVTAGCVSVAGGCKSVAGGWNLASISTESAVIARREFPIYDDSTLATGIRRATQPAVGDQPSIFSCESAHVSSAAPAHVGVGRSKDQSATQFLHGP